ncbi:MAG: restriction endonuclease [Methanobacteriota archaeon]
MKTLLPTKFSDVEETISTLLDELGFSIKSVKLEGKCASFKAESQHSGDTSVTLIRFYFRKRKVGEVDLKKIMGEVKKEKYSKALVISLSDFTAGSHKYALKKPIDLVDSGEFERIASKHELKVGGKESEEELFVYEFSFQDNLSKKTAEKILGDKAKKSLALFGKPIEKIVGVVRKLTPIAKVSLTLNGISKSYFVNLNTGALYFVRTDFFSKKLVLDDVDFLGLTSDLSDNGILFLGEIVRARNISAIDVGLGIDLTLHEKTGILLRLKARKLVGVVEKNEATYLSNVNIPPLNQDRYNLEEYYIVERNLKSDSESDKIRFEIQDTLKKMSLFFGSETMLEKVAYLPYYEGTYVNRKNQVRYRTLRSLRLKSGRVGDD